MKILVDMNLSPEWCDVLSRHGHEAMHWSALGPGNAPDTEIMEWARRNSAIVFTHDLDFGTLLALTNESGPSVIQVRTQDPTHEAMAAVVVAAITQFQTELRQGAIVVVTPATAKARVLPLRPESTP